MSKVDISTVRMPNDVFVEQLLDTEDDAVYFYNTDTRKLVLKVDSSSYCHVLEDGTDGNKNYKGIGKIHMNLDYTLYYKSYDSEEELQLNHKDFMKAEVVLFKHLIETQIITL